MEKEKFYKQIFELTQKLKSEKAEDELLKSQIEAEQKEQEKAAKKIKALKISRRIESIKYRETEELLNKFEQHFEKTLKNFIKDNVDIIFDKQGNFGLFKRDVDFSFDFVGEEVHKKYQYKFIKSILLDYIEKEKLPVSLMVSTKPYMILNIFKHPSKIVSTIRANFVIDDKYIQSILSQGNIVYEKDTLMDMSSVALTRKRKSNTL